MTSAIIVAAGSSQRMGFDKLFADLDGRPVLAHTIAAFEACPEITEILIITSADRLGATRTIARDYGFSKVTRLVEGGAQRHDSVWAGIQRIDPRSALIAVHDGARPLIAPAQITRCIESARQHRAAASAHPITDTVKRADEQLRVTAAVDRSGLWAMETPQVFERGLLIASYRRVLAAGELVTDEVSAVDVPVQLVPNESPNPKITFPTDLATAAKLLG